MLQRHPGQATRLGTWCARFVGVLTVAVLMAVLGAFSSAQSKNEPADKAKVDRNGDPLPAGTLARMGSLRWRHAEPVSFVAYTPDGKGVLTASQDGIIRLWDRDTGKEIRRFKGEQPLPMIAGRGVMMGGWNQGAGARVALSHDGKTVAAVQGNVAIQLWDVDTGKEIRQLKIPPTGVNSILFAPDGKSIATRGFDRTTYVLETQSGKQLHALKGKQPQAGGVRFAIGGNIGEANGYAFSTDSKTIATGEMDFDAMKIPTYLKFTDLSNGKEIRRFEGSISSIAYSPDGKILAHGTGNDIQLREADTGKEIRKIDNTAGIAGLTFSADSKTIAAKGRDQIVRLFETNTGKSIHTLGEAPVQAGGGVNVAFFAFGNVAESRDFAFSSDSKVVAMGGSPALRFFTVADGKEQAQAGGHRASVTTVMVTPDGKMMISRGADNTIRRWDAVTGAELGQFAEPKGTTGAVFSFDGKSVALANVDGTIRLHVVADGKELHQLKGHQNGTAALAFAPNGKRLASRGSADNTIRIHDLATGGELKQITINPQAPVANPQGGFAINGMGGPSGQGLAFSPDSQTLAANVNAGNAMMRFQGGAPPPAAENKLHFWDVATGKELRKITLPTGRVINSLAYSPDGRLLASENTDQTFSLWEVASGKERAVLGQSVPMVGQPNQPFVIVGGGIGGVGNQAKLATTALAFSPDGSILAARAYQHIVRAWDVSLAKEIGTLKGHDGHVQAVAFAADGKTLASASADTTLLVWDLARLNREPTAPAVALEAKQVEALWADLLSPDGVKAGRSILTLASSPKSATQFLAEKLKPAPPVDVTKLDQAILDLDSSNFAKRTKATSEIEKFGELAIPALNKVLAANPTVETRRRIEPILEKLITGALNAEEVRLVRAIEVLERVGTSEARNVLQALAQGAPGALPTREAQKVLERLPK